MKYKLLRKCKIEMVFFRIKLSYDSNILYLYLHVYIYML